MHALRNRANFLIGDLNSFYLRFKRNKVPLWLAWATLSFCFPSIILGYGLKDHKYCILKITVVASAFFSEF